MKARMLIIAALAACGDDGSMATQTVKLHASAVKLLAVQPQGQAWQTLEVPADGEVTATFRDGPYVVVSVCDEPDLFDYFVVFGGTGVAALDLQCTAPPSSVKVSLAAGSTARAAVGNYPLVGDVSWQIPPGTYDIAAYDKTLTPPRFEIRRGVPVTADTVLTFDLATTGAPLVPITVTTNASADESVIGSGSFHTAGGTRLSLPQSMTGDPHVWRVPGSALQAGDYQTIRASASLDKANHGSTRKIIASAASIALTLPARLSSVMATWEPSGHVSWQGTGDWTSAYYYAADADLTKMFDVYVTPQWIADNGPLSSIEVPVPTDIPGWQPAWTLPPAAGLEWSLSLDHEVADGELDQAGWSDSFATARRARVQSKAAIHAQRLHDLR